MKRAAALALALVLAACGSGEAPKTAAPAGSGLKTALVELREIELTYSAKR